MVRYAWNPDKNDWLHQTRGLGLEDVVVAIQTGGLLDIIAHHNPTRYPRQRLLVIKIGDYAYMVPCIVEGDEYFLKTIYASRKATRDYLHKEE